MNVRQLFLYNLTYCKIKYHYHLVNTQTDISNAAPNHRRSNKPMEWHPRHRHHIPRTQLLIQLRLHTLVVGLYVGFSSRVKWCIGFGNMGDLKNPPGCGKCQASCCNPCGPPEPRKRAPEKQEQEQHITVWHNNPEKRRPGIWFIL